MRFTNESFLEKFVDGDFFMAGDVIYRYQNALIMKIPHENNYYTNIYEISLDDWINDSEENSQDADSKFRKTTVIVLE